MLTEGDSHDVVPNNRCVLGDVTNSCGKRPLPLVQSKFASGNDTYQENIEAGAEDSKFNRSVCGGVESSLSKKGQTSCMPEIDKGMVDVKGKGLALPKAKRRSRNVVPSVGYGSIRENAQPNVPISSEKTNDHSTLQLRSSGAVGHLILDESSRNSFSFGEISPEPEEESQEDCETDSAYFVSLDNQIGKRHEISSTLRDRVHGGGILTRELFDKTFSLRCSSTSVPSDFEMASTEGHSNAHATLMGASNNVKDNRGSGKDCSCSFCLKAGYMLADLHYQDTRGRLAALKKSKRHARFLEGKCFSDDQTAKIDRDNSKKSTELKFDLMQRCKSLFLHTEDALERESAELHTNLVKLKELREDCKRDLEKINTVLPDKT